MEQQIDRETLEKRPGILMVGASNVGKRTLLSRLLNVDFEDASDSPSEVLVQGWTINTKYYTADISVWMAHLLDGLSVSSLPNLNQLAALVMVFDLSDLSSLAALKEWISHTDIQQFDILLCIGNKVDLITGHPAHAEYRRRLLRVGDSFVGPDTDFSVFGISETEGSSLLGDEEPSLEIRRSCLEWCMERNIEYIEACASNIDFDKCLSVDGDSQGVERLFGALSAHMWPGMVLKSGNRIPEPLLPERQELSEEESDYEFEYEVLSRGSAEPWDDAEERWVSAHGPIEASSSGESAAVEAINSNLESGTGNDQGESLSSSSLASGHTENGREIVDEAPESRDMIDPYKGRNFELEELEQLMSEIGNMRENLRLTPDFQRREMAAQLAMRMAVMFGESSSDEERFD
ncbi:hypothetical protein Ancab_004955 [Ancistrocladus abbreviatus]